MSVCACVCECVRVCGTRPHHVRSHPGLHWKQRITSALECAKQRLVIAWKSAVIWTVHVKSRGSISFICNNPPHHFTVIPQQIQSILYRYDWTHISMYPAYVQWRSHPIKIFLTFDDKTPGARNHMQRPDVYLKVQGLILRTCHRYVFHIALSL